MNTRKKKCSLSTVGHRCQTMMWTEPQPNLTVFLFWPQEQSASAPTSGIWPATALFLFSTCAGNTWPRSCALWVTSTRWPAFHFVMSYLLWSRMSISTGVGFHTDSTFHLSGKYQGSSVCHLFVSLSVRLAFYSTTSRAENESWAPLAGRKKHWMRAVSKRVETLFKIR